MKNVLVLHLSDSWLRYGSLTELHKGGPASAGSGQLLFL
jgi:hypothetical protein